MSYQDLYIGYQESHTFSRAGKKALESLDKMDCLDALRVAQVLIAMAETKCEEQRQSEEVMHKPKAGYVYQDSFQDIFAAAYAK